MKDEKLNELWVKVEELHKKEKDKAEEEKKKRNELKEKINKISEIIFRGLWPYNVPVHKDDDEGRDYAICPLCGEKLSLMFLISREGEMAKFVIDEYLSWEDKDIYYFVCKGSCGYEYVGDWREKPMPTPKPSGGAPGSAGLWPTKYDTPSRWKRFWKFCKRWMDLGFGGDK